MILEIRDARGVATWHRLDTLPLVIGRAPSSDIILDDPYLDARHATITRDESGAIGIADLGSVNGTLLGGTRGEGHHVVQPGDEVRIGRTTLRFRALDEAVVPALADDSSVHGAAPVQIPAPTPVILLPPGPSTRGGRTVEWLLTTTRGRLLALATMVAAFALSDWLGETERSIGGDVLAAGLGAAAIAFIWAALWSLAGRGSDKRPHLMAHLAVVSLALTAMLVLTNVNGWLSFLFPAAGLRTVLFVAVTLGVIAALVAGHLSVTTSLPRRRRWRVGFVTACAMTVLFAAIGLLGDDDEFTDVPKFAAELKPLSPRFVPSRTVEQFGVEMTELKDEVDEALQKQSAR